MAKIQLRDLRHSYAARPDGESDWALKRLTIDWSDGGAYALLGPSGCGKTTLLNVISGLLRPTEGQILFDGRDVTGASPEERNIAQVFQFPVIYDTMTVYDNLAFPLRNRGVEPGEVDRRVREVAEMLELEDMLRHRAAGLTADGKQKISLGRGLARSDVNVIMFDEPLTVIDPHLKWVLRSKLKELHQRIRVTMIYVTHDQTEALTFADQVVVMNDGQIVQTGTPVELFERPNHTFVGHFIGSPGMNVLPCEIAGGRVVFAGQAVDSVNAGDYRGDGGRLELGVRPEFVSFVPQGAAGGIPVRVVKALDAGRHRIVETEHDGHKIKMLVPEGQPIPSDTAHVRFAPERSWVYRDGWLITGEEAAP
ncbi:MAG: ABC transporter ATP-binding protein [Thalassobaculum sp.]|uniref:ABC transporter ATP-binding protein n=1 Tax=Thalassobaculum sp. TaxID=2022740 RepID=UPI0032EB92E6